MRIANNRLSRRGLLRLGLIGSAGFLTAAALAGCGEEQAAKAPAAATKAAETKAAAAAAPAATTAAAKPQAGPITLKIHGRLTPIDDMWAEDADQYKKEHPNVTIEYERTPGQEYTQKQLLMAGTRTSGDAFWYCSVCLYQQFAAAGVFVDHTPFIKAAGFNLDTLLTAAVATNTFEGKLHGLPIQAHPGLIVLYLNEDIFKDAGVPLPDDTKWTYQDYREISQKLNKKEGDKTVRWGHRQNHHYYYLQVVMRAFGGDALDKEGKKILFDTPVGHESIGLLAKMVTEDKSSPTAAENPSGGPDLFAAGRIGMTRSGIYTLFTANETYKSFKWTGVRAPNGLKTPMRGMMEADGWSILDTSKHPDEMFAVMARWASPEFGTKLGLRGVTPGATKAAWTAPELLTDPMRKKFFGLIDTADPLNVPNNTRNNELWRTSDQEFDKLFNAEEKDVDATITRVNGVLQGIVDKPRPNRAEFGKT